MPTAHIHCELQFTIFQKSIDGVRGMGTASQVRNQIEWMRYKINGAAAFMHRQKENHDRRMAKPRKKKIRTKTKRNFSCPNLLCEKKQRTTQTKTWRRNRTEASEWKKEKNRWSVRLSIRSHFSIFAVLARDACVCLCVCWTTGGHVRSTCSFAYKLWYFLCRCAAASTEWMLCFVCTHRSAGRRHFRHKSQTAFRFLFFLPPHSTSYSHHSVCPLSTFRSTMDHAVDCATLIQCCATSFSLCAFSLEWIFHLSTWNGCVGPPRDPPTYILSHFSVSVSPHTTSQPVAAKATAAHSSAARTERKWKNENQKHINNYGSESQTDRQRERKSSVLTYTFLSFFVGVGFDALVRCVVHTTTYCSRLTINNKWMENDEEKHLQNHFPLDKFMSFFHCRFSISHPSPGSSFHFSGGSNN